MRVLNSILKSFKRIQTVKILFLYTYCLFVDCFPLWLGVFLLLIAPATQIELLTSIIRYGSFIQAEKRYSNQDGIPPLFLGDVSAIQTDHQYARKESDWRLLVWRYEDFTHSSC